MINNKLNYKKISLLVISTFVMLSLNAYANGRDRIEFKSRIVDQDAKSVSDGNYNLKFMLFNAPTGGTPLWQEERSGVALRRGSFNVELGAVNPISKTIFAQNENLYVQICFDANNIAGDGIGICGGRYEEQFNTRKFLNNVPWSFRSLGLGPVTIGQGETAYNVNTLGNAGNIFEWEFNGADRFVLNTSGDMTLTNGTSSFILSPSNERITLTNNSDIFFGTRSLKNTSSSSNSGASIIGVFDGNFNVISGKDVQKVFESIDFQLNSFTASNTWLTSGSDIYNNSTNVGIGTNAPTRLIDINGVGRFRTTTAPVTPLVGDIYSDGNNLYFYNGITWDDLTATAVGGGDDLGNHIATQNVILNGNWLSGDGGNEGAFVSSAGLVGIGTNAPARILDINGSIRIRTTAVPGAPASGDIYSDGTNLYFFNGSTWDDLTAVGSGADNLGNHTATQNVILNGNWLSGDGGSEGVFVSAAGLVGIGTNAPARILDINGAARFRTTATPGSPVAGDIYSNGTDLFYYNGSTWDDLTALGLDNLGNHTATQNVILNGNWLSGDGGSEGVFVSAAGLVGIGTNSPGRALDINGAARFRTVATPGTPVAGDIYSDGTDLFFYNGSTWDDLTALGLDNLGNHTATQNLNMSGFWISNDGGDEGVWVDTAGLVGIGTNAPTAILDINGSARFRTTTAPGTPLAGHIYSDGTNLYFYNGATWDDLTDVGSGADNLGDHTATQNIVLSGNWLSGDGGNEGLYIDSNGFIGINTNAPSHVMHMVNSSANGNPLTGARNSFYIDTDYDPTGAIGSEIANVFEFVGDVLAGDGSAFTRFRGIRGTVNNNSTNLTGGLFGSSILANNFGTTNVSVGGISQSRNHSTGILTSSLEGAELIARNDGTVAIDSIGVVILNDNYGDSGLAMLGANLQTTNRAGATVIDLIGIRNSTRNTDGTVTGNTYGIFNDTRFGYSGIDAFGFYNMVGASFSGDTSTATNLIGIHNQLNASNNIDELQISDNVVGINNLINGYVQAGNNMYNIYNINNTQSDTFGSAYGFYNYVNPAGDVYGSAYGIYNSVNPTGSYYAKYGLYSTDDVTDVYLNYDGLYSIYTDDLANFQGGIILGDTSDTTEGTIRFTGTDFEGYVGGGWVSLTAGGGGGGGVTNDFEISYVTDTTDNFAIGGTEYLSSAFGFEINSFGNILHINSDLNSASSNIIFNDGSGGSFIVSMQDDVTDYLGFSGPIVVGTNSTSSQYGFVHIYKYSSEPHLYLDASIDSSDPFILNDGALWYNGNALNFYSNGNTFNLLNWQTNLTSDVYYNTGYVGIGTDSPVATLSVNGAANFTGDDVTIDNANMFIFGGSLCVNDDSFDCPTLDPGTVYGEFAYSEFDIAENILAETNVQPAEIVSIKEGQKEVVRRSNKTYDNNIIGVISTDPGVTGGKNLKSWGGFVPQPLALAGRVPVKINLEGGVIKAGDPITSSSTAGEGMKANASGKIVGYAMEDYDGTSTKKSIVVFIDPGYYTKETTASNTSTTTVDDAYVSNLFKVLFDERLSFGTTEIAATKSSVEISNTKIKSSSVILITATNSTNGLVPFIGSQLNGKFTINLDSNTSSNIKFNYLILNE